MQDAAGGGTAGGFAVGPEWDFVLGAPLGAAVLTEEGRIIACNARLLGLLRLGTVAAQHVNALQSLVPNVRAALDAVAPGSIFERRIEIAAPEGPIALEAAHVEVPLSRGDRGLAVVVAETALQRRSVHERNRGLRELVDDAPFVCVRLDALSLAPLYVSRTIEAWFGIPGEAFAADPTLYTSLFDRAELPRWEHLCDAARSGEQSAAVLAMRVPSETPRFVRHQLWPVLDGSGRVRLIEGMLRDVSVRRLLRTLRDRIVDRTHNEAMRRQLLANVSHELRTPLVSITGYSELLLKEAHGPLTEKQRQALNVIDGSSRRLGELIERLLLFREAEEGRLQLREALFDLRLEVGQAVARHADAMAQKQLTIEVELGDQPVLVRGDAERLRDVFFALLDNAIKFSNQGGAIKVALRRLATVAELTVTDRGIGIPPEQRARVFERFYQIDSSPTRRFSGAGLGLALARDLVTRHGGAIHVDEPPGGGSRFTVRLPLDTVLTDDVSAPSRGHERRLLLIAADPNEMVSLRLAELRSSGIPGLPEVELLFAHSESDVVRRARRYRPDAIALLLRISSRALIELDTDPQPLGVPVFVSDRSDAAMLVPADRRISVADRHALTDGLARLLAPKRPAQARVVVVEDEPEILDFARFLLEREGYVASCYQSGETALRHIDRSTDLVVLDLALYDMDGIELCRRLKRSIDLVDVPILVMTAMSGDEVRRMAIDAGATGFLPKPFTVEQFVGQIRQHLRHHTADRAADRAAE